jgi:hypothetical protein
MKWIYWYMFILYRFIIYSIYNIILWYNDNKQEQSLIYLFTYDKLYWQPIIQVNT